MTKNIWIEGHLSNTWNGVLHLPKEQLFDADEFFGHYIDPISVKEGEKALYHLRKEGRRIIKHRQKKVPRPVQNRSI